MVSRMETSAIDFTPMGLDADWPARRWLELINGRHDKPARGVRLGHANDSAMVLTCTYPRARFDDEVSATGSDPVREIAHETTYSQINLVLHQIRTPGSRPDQVQLAPVADLSPYDLSLDPLDIGAMHWELWASQTELAYEDLTPALAAL
jgi:hypothetical protein